MECIGACAGLMDDFMARFAKPIDTRMVDNAKGALESMSTNTTDLRAAKRAIVAAMVDDTMKEDRLVMTVAERLGVHKRTVNKGIEHRQTALANDTPKKWTCLTR